MEVAGSGLVPKEVADSGLLPRGCSLVPTPVDVADSWLGPVPVTVAGPGLVL